MTLLSPAYWILGYLLGSLPFALWVTRLVKGVDVRDGGSGHVTTTNTIRQAGWMSGVAVFVLDFGKGFLAVWLALHAGLPAWSIGLTGALAVAGHCWPVFAQFRGGMGLATTAGALTAVSVVGFLLSFATLLFFVLVLRHSARGSLFAGVVAAPLLWLVGLRGAVIWLAAGAGIVVAIRFMVDWNRKYRELWLDREKKVS
jgi:glycerol-3-phosphate acyltransferase PlsY